ncbi:MAG TPA: aminodeoxychorismate/anthranilate synthase component II [Alphaproteobacteria bacterium]|nr:aminodeoxychorismate/anthranilate synthase component II [Alphaproteobacteria bacterium]
MYLLIDNYDSFTYNLFHYLGELGAEVSVWRNDAISVQDAVAMAPEGIILSPGPCDPDRAGICVPLVNAAAGRFPILGVCLGHQAVGQAFGGRIVRGPVPMHGKTSLIHHNGRDIFRSLANPFPATRYHSLICAHEGLPTCLEVTARTNEGIVMGLRHRQFPIFGVQFHPESIETAEGHKLLANFLALAKPGALAA